MPIYYKGVELSNARADLVVDQLIVVELKAVASIAALHRAQLSSYLKAGGFRLGLLINFNVFLLRDGVARVIESALPERDL